MKVVKVATKKAKPTYGNELKVKVVSFNKAATLDSIIEYFESITGLKVNSFTDLNFQNNKNMVVKISFPENSKFGYDEAYMYLAFLLRHNGIKFTLNGVDGELLLNGIAKYEIVNTNNSIKEFPECTMLSCTMNSINASIEFDRIIYIIEIIHDITIDIVNDFSEHGLREFYRSVTIKVPNKAVTDFCKIIDKKDFISFNK